MRSFGVPSAIALGGLALLGLIPVVFLVSSPQPAEDSDSRVPADVVQVGERLYAGNCAVCHGVRGEGELNWKVQRSDLTYPAPPHDSTGHTWHHSDQLLHEIIEEGTAKDDTATYRGRMPAWRDRLSSDEIDAVIAYLKSLWGDKERQFQAEVTRQEREVR